MATISPPMKTAYEILESHGIDPNAPPAKLKPIPTKATKSGYLGVYPAVSAACPQLTRSRRNYRCPPHRSSSAQAGGRRRCSAGPSVATRAPSKRAA
eukprot:852141-Prymnesium_polylepis.1